MTSANGGLQRSSPSSTATFTPPTLPLAPDLYSLANPAQSVPFSTPLANARYSIQAIKTAEGKATPYVKWSITIFDLRKGLNKQRGLWPDVHNQMASSTLDGRGLNTLSLPLLTTTQTGSSVTPDLTGPVLHADCFDTSFYANGSTANKSIFKPTSSSNPALTAVTISPAARIFSITPIIVGGATNAQRLMIGMLGTASRLMTDATGTLSGTSFADSDVYGACQIPGTAYPTVLIVNTSIKTLDLTGGINQTTTTTVATVPSGGCMLGAKGLGNSGYIRIYMWFPEKNGGTNQMGMLDGSNKFIKGFVSSVKVDGTDWQKTDCGLEHITFACLWRDGIVATDGYQIKFFNGRVSEPIRVFADRTPNSDQTLQVVGLEPNGDELRVRIEATGISGNPVCLEWIEAYDPFLKTFQPVSGQTAESNATQPLAIGAIPDGGKSVFGYSYRYINGTGWRYQYVPAYGVNTYTLRKTSGAQAATGQAYEPSGTATLPFGQIPGLEGWPMVVSRISGNPDVDGMGTGGTPGTIAWSCGGMTATFVTGATQGRQVFTFPANRNVVYELQPSVTMTQQSGGTDPTRFTGNALPVTIEGIARQPDALEYPLFSDQTR